MWRSIQKGPYERPMIPDLDDTQVKILEPLSKMTESNKKQYIADVKFMNYLLQAIPNDIYNSVDACKNAKEMWERIKRLMYGSDVTNHVRHSRLMNVFDKFAAKEGESLESVYERLITLWSKYVTMVRHNQTGDTISYDQLYDSLVQFEPHVQVSKAKRASRNHDPLALIAHSNAFSSKSHASPSYSHSPQPYYVTHPLSVVDYEEDYQGELQGDSQEDKLTTAMMLLARAITHKFSTSTNNRLRTSSNTRYQAVIQDGRVDIQTKNAGYGGNGNRNTEIQNKNQAFNACNGNDESNHIVQRVSGTESNMGKANVKCYNCNKKGHYARDCLKSRVRDAKYFIEQMLLDMKDEAESNLNDEENDFMLDNSFGDETLEELTAAVMAQIQPANDNGVHEHKNHGKRKTVINTSNDDQIDSNIDDLYVENNAKKAFKERENRYLKDIVGLKEKLSSHDRIVYKTDQSIQSIHMLGKTPNKVYDPFLKVGLGYKNLERLKKAIAAQPKMYHGEMLYSTKLNIDSPDSDETLADAEESRLKMRNKMVQLDYGKLNALYETFVPQNEPSVNKYIFQFLLLLMNVLSQMKYSRVKRALFTIPMETKSKNLGATSVVVKSRFSVARTPTTTNKLILDSIMNGDLNCYEIHWNIALGMFTSKQFTGIDDLSRQSHVMSAQILKIRTDNRTKFKNEKLRSFYAKLGIIHHTSIARTPQQNGGVERRNHTLVEVTRTMLIFSKTPEFLGAKAIATEDIAELDGNTIMHSFKNPEFKDVESSSNYQARPNHATVSIMNIGYI
ncbi:retrovirus-related pol polyprotein from transposon TNT 1-94 [Tanacetum coccineum]